MRTESCLRRDNLDLQHHKTVAQTVANAVAETVAETPRQYFTFAQHGSASSPDPFSAEKSN